MWDSQLIVDFFTEKLGRLSFMVRVPKSSKGKMKRQLFPEEYLPIVEGAIDGALRIHEQEKEPVCV